MERRGEISDRGNQLREVREENRTRQAAVLDIGQLRDQFARRQAEEAARRQEAEEKKLLAEVEAEFVGKGPINRESILNRWRYQSSRSIPDVRNARALWERDEHDPDAKAWRATKGAIDAYTGDLARAAAEINRWHEAHPVQTALLWAGLKKKTTELQQLERQHADTMKFLEGSQRRLQEHEESWTTKKRDEYRQQLEREGEGIRRARRRLEIIAKHPDHFRQLWEREEQVFKRQLQQERNQRRTHDRDRDGGGWSR